MATVSVVWGNHLPVWGASKRSRSHRSPRCRRKMSGLAMVILILDDFETLKKMEYPLIKSPIIAYLENFGYLAPQFLKHGHWISFVSFRKVSAGEIHFQQFTNGTYFVLTVTHSLCQTCQISLLLHHIGTQIIPNPKLSQFASFASQANERIHSKTLCSCVARPVGAVVATMRLCYTKVFELLSSSLLNQQERYKRASLSQTYWFCSILPCLP